jgi:hypothetical protein
MMDDSVQRQLGWSEERKSAWRIERLLEEEIKLLQQILARLPAPATYLPTVGVVVVRE